MDRLSSRERMKLCLTGQEADRIACAPDISCMVPVRLSGKSFFDVHLFNKLPLWKAYLNAVDYFGMDGWFAYGQVDFQTKTDVRWESAMREEAGRKIVHYTMKTPKGDLTQEVTFFQDNPPVTSEALIKNFKEDFPKFKYFFSEITGYNADVYREQVKELGEKGIMAINLPASGMHIFSSYFQGNLEAAIYAYYDYPELFEELDELFNHQTMQKLEIVLDLKPDSVLTGGSGSITLQSEDLFDKFEFEPIRRIAAACKSAGVICGVHSCGREEYLIKRCAEETELDYVNPLEIPPMGDCTIAGIKKKYGKKISLMGNLHTTNVMLKGTADDVRRESLIAMRDGGLGGGFVLSTGDQCGRDTPDANLFAMVETAKKFGAYPLDIDAMQTEIDRQQR